MTTSKIQWRLVQIIIAERKAAGITQVELARILRRSQSRIARLEKGERRIDVVEFIEVAKAIGFDPARAIKQLAAD